VKRAKLRFGTGFRVAIGNRRCQAAQMVIEPGDSEGGPQNRHHGTDQWLYVVAGKGLARVNGRPYRLAAGVLLLIERGNKHEVKNTGRTPLRTLNFYTPPAYRKDGKELPAARP
jgi:mannose-6-phosphate isomerase-like protein (cupin superfamily)